MLFKTLFRNALLLMVCFFALSFQMAFSQVDSDTETVASPICDEESGSGKSYSQSG
jgi:hypothetical protein